VEHGLENRNGANHCFLNAAIQALWNLYTFRRRFLDAPEHWHRPLEGSLSSSVSAAAADASAGSREGRPLSEGSTSSAKSPRNTEATLPPMAGSSSDIMSAADPGIPCGEGSDPSSERACDGTPAPREAAPTEQRADAIRLAPEAEGCCYCALKAVFTQYQHSEATTLPPDVLRNALSQVYTAQGRFQIGEMEDATETIEALLDALHATHVCEDVEQPYPRSTGGEPQQLPADGAVGSSSSSSASAAAGTLPQGPSSPRSRISRLAEGAERVEAASDLACTPPCVAHTVFGVEYVDVPRCTNCEATGEPVIEIRGSPFLYRVYIADLLALQGRSADSAVGEQDPLSISSMTDQVNRITARLSGRRPNLQAWLRQLCQRQVASKCLECNSLRTVVTERWLTRTPQAFLISLIWPSSQPSREALSLILSSVQPKLRVDRIFQTERGVLAAPRSPRQGKETGCLGPATDYGPPSEEEDDGDVEPHLFRGMICYYGAHYVAFFWCFMRMRWVLFDDMQVREEKDWACVSNLIASGRYVPTLLFYERLDRLVSPEALRELQRQMSEFEDAKSTCTMA